MTFTALILRRLALGIAFIFATLAPAAMAEVATPTGEVILTVDGAIEGGQPVDLDLAGLMAMPSETFKTTTIWTEGELTFTGVPLAALLKEIGATGTVVVAEALNGYAVEIPVADLTETAPILAYHIDGQPFSRRDKGPLWVVFPYDSDDRYKSETVYAYSIWQLRKISVK